MRNSIEMWGSYSIAPSIGEPDFHVIALPAESLIALARLISSVPFDGLRLEIGSGWLEFELSSKSGLAAEVDSEGGVVIRADSRTFWNLSQRIRAIANTDHDYPDHIHFDTGFTEPPKGLSDLVLERAQDPG